MLILLEDRIEMERAERLLRRSLVRSWRRSEMRSVGWRPRKQTLTIHHNGAYYFTFGDPNKRARSPRYWNSFGKYNPTGTLHIAVEINVATEPDTRRVAGFFARDASTGVVYLMHDGRIGGGRLGIGKNGYLDFSNAKLVPVLTSSGGIRRAMVVAAVNGRSAAADIGRFVQSVVAFKAGRPIDTRRNRSVGDGRNREKLDDYYDEFFGLTKRKRIRAVEYVTRHGEIVKALAGWRGKKLLATERIVKSSKIDLAVQTGTKLTEVYEVKPTCARFSLYTAIGQVFVHGPRSLKLRRFVVLPTGDSIPRDIDQALQGGEIGVIRFRMTRHAVSILD